MSADDPKAESRESRGSTLIAVEQRSLRIGPLPDPADLASYEQIVPGGAERILRMAEEGAAHRQALERTVVNSDISARETGFRLEARGQSFALAIGLATLAACLTAALTGHDGVAIALAASSFVGVVAAFLRSRLAIARSGARAQRP